MLGEASRKAPERVETARLVLRRPSADDVDAIFRYAQDAEVTRYLSWPRHTSPADTRFFLGFSDGQWERWPGGPYVIAMRDTGVVVGSTGFTFEDRPDTAMTGYVLAREAWHHGYASEALRAVVAVAASIGVTRLDAFCHCAHAASAHVLEKCGFVREAVLPSHSRFPNLSGDAPCDVFVYAIAPVLMATTSSP